MEINQLDFSSDPDDVWMQAVHKIWKRDQELKAVAKAEGREFCPTDDEGIQPHQRIDCLRAWGVPERILTNLGVLKETRSVNTVRAFALCPREAWCLVLSADKGAGKSTAAATWLYENVPADKNAYTYRYWWTGTRIARMSSYASELDKMMASRLMVIDDLGVEYLDKNGNLLQKLDELIDWRYSNYLRTILTTNLNAGEFKDRYGERIADRIREGFQYGGSFMEFSDPSMRAKQKERE